MCSNLCNKIIISRLRGGEKNYYGTLLVNQRCLTPFPQQYCETAKNRFRQCADFETKRQFLLDYAEKVTYWNDKIAVHGSVPVTIKLEHGRESETNKVGFQIEMHTAITV